ncbi:MAG: acyltransferase family protein [Novosphingobium meiothermophilum]
MRIFFGGEAIGACMDGPRSRHNAFDSLRLCAALTVIWSHSYLLTSGNYGSEPLYWASSGQTTMGSLAVGVFFVISGMFISASFERSHSKLDFARNRALRIMPALIVVIALLALAIGPLVTTIPLEKYFSQKETWTYFRNILFMPMALYLPGVFESNTLRTVNESIWTLKFEVACYIIAAAVLMLKNFVRPIVFAGWIASFLVVRFWPNANTVSGVEYYIVAIARMFRFFGAGMLIYLYRHQIPLNARLAWASLALILPFLVTDWFVEAAAIIGAYSVIAFGYLAPPGFRALAARGDVSYGVYIYGWPLQQLIWPMGQGLPMHWLINTAVAIPMALAMGWASWLLVERPALSLKRRN